MYGYSIVTEQQICVQKLQIDDAKADDFGYGSRSDSRVTNDYRLRTIVFCVGTLFVFSILYIFFLKNISETKKPPF